MATIRPGAFGAAACLLLGLTSGGFADTLAAQPSFSGTAVGFAASKPYAGGTLTVVGPNGFVARVSSRNGLPSLNLVNFGSVADGRYSYQLSAATAQLDTSAVAQNNGRGTSGFKPRRGDALSGGFTVRGGSIVLPPAATAFRSGGAQDQD